jgi:class 3 adenylate cyclase
VFGATVNLAGRLEPFNKNHGAEILVSGALAERRLGRLRLPRGHRQAEGL